MSLHSISVRWGELLVCSNLCWFKFLLASVAPAGGDQPFPEHDQTVL